MINLDIIPNVAALDSGKKNANGALLSSLIMFYLGIAAFVIVCLIPPFTIFLPIFIPIIAVIFIFVHLAYLWKFMERAGNKMQSLIDTQVNTFVTTQDKKQKNIQIDMKKDIKGII